MAIPRLVKPLCALVFVAALLSGCAAKPPVLLIPPPREGAFPPKPAWREVARDADILRIGALNAAWPAALAEGRRARFGKAIEAEGSLLDPAAALPRPETPPGRYQCRLIRFAGRGGLGPAFAAFKPYFCYVEQEGELTTLVKETGTERQAGRLWPDSETRLIFLGALALGKEQPPAYGARPERDLAGVLERVAPFRWRLVIPRSRGGLDILEMIPFTEGISPAAP